MSALATADLSRRAVARAESAVDRRNWFYPFIGCAALLICLLIANPFNEAGFNDDWSYARVAMKLAQTGRMQYNGWGSPILLFQSFWAVPWIRAFGFSFPVLQASMIPVSLGFVLLVYATGRALGLSRELSAFASMATATSPMFLPMAASFMTEAPGCFFSMLCIYAAVRSVQSEDSRIAARWLWVLTAAGLAGGANRQVVWIAPITLIPYLCWQRRTNRKFRTHAVAAYAASGAIILAITYFLSQPYGPLELSQKQRTWVLHHEWGSAANLIGSLLLSCVALSLPAYCCLASLIRRKPFTWWLITIPAVVLLSFEGIVLTGFVAPYGNCILSWIGIATEGQEWFGAKPASLPPWIRIGLTAMVNVSVAPSIAWVVRNRRNFRGTAQGQLLAIFGIFTLGSIALMLPGAMVGLAFDRYMLPILPLVMLAVLMQYAKHNRSIPVVAWGCLAVFAFYGITTTHDYAASLRARMAAASALQKGGISRDRISAGFEYDGWTELERSEYARVVQYQDSMADDHAKGFWFWFWDHTPSLHPEYVVLNWTSPEPVRGVVSEVDFDAWLPPFRRHAVVWRRSDLTAAYQAARITAVLR